MNQYVLQIFTLIVVNFGVGLYYVLDDFKNYACELGGLCVAKLGLGNVYAICLESDFCFCVFWLC